MSRYRHVVLSVAAFAAAACGTKIEYTPTNTAPRPMTARAPEQVEVFNASKPTKAFVEVGVLEAQQQSAYSRDNSSAIMAKLRKEAGDRGCDGVIVNGSNDATVGSTYEGTGSTDTLKGYRATCIVYR
jgi:hypothetical protein